MAPTDDTGPPVADEPLGATVRAPQDHHAALWSGLVERSDALTATVATSHNDVNARPTLVEFLRGDIFAHLETEEQVLYAAARKVGAHDLVATLELDHRFMLQLVEQIDKADTALEAALLARALVVLVALRIEKEDTVVLPALTEAGVDVSAVLDRMVVRMATNYDSHFTYI